MGRMKTKGRLLAVLALCLGLALTAGPASAMYDCTGIWEAEHIFSDIEIHVSQDGDRIEGVVYVHGMFGGVDTYHYTGHVYEDGRIEASHHSGHTFEGHILADGQGEGTLTTAKRHYHIHLDATRVSTTCPPDATAGN